MTRQSKHDLRAPLRIHMEGPAARHHRLALQDLVLFGRYLQTAIDRIALVLSGQDLSLQKGRKPAEVERSCALDVVAISPGSVSITCDLPSMGQHRPFDDLGEEAVRAFVQGIGSIGNPEESLPRGYDKGVLLALREGGKLLDHGIERISYDFETGAGRWHSCYTQAVHQAVVARILQPIRHRSVVEGRLLMGDFKDTGLRCRIHPPIGSPVQCEFDEGLKEAVLGGMMRYVRVVGEANEADGVIRQLKIEDIELLDKTAEAEEKEAKAFFDPRAELEALAAQQRVGAIADF